MITIILPHNHACFIDKEDYDKIKDIPWRSHYNTCTKSYYADGVIKVEGKWKMVRMHRIIMNAQKGETIDHINHDTLDNRKTNLRFCTPTQNQANSKRVKRLGLYKGITFYKDRNKWSAQIQCNKIKKHLGFYNNQKDAAIAYNEAAINTFNEFALIDNVI